MIEFRSQWFGVLSAFVLAVAGATTANIYRSHRQEPRNALPNVSYVAGKRILFVYIGSEECKASLDPGFAKKVAELREAVRRQAANEGVSFSTLGISAGRSPELGTEYLAKFGPFDEVTSGNGLLNDGAIHYMLQTLPGDAMVPQVLVVERQLDSLEPGYAFINERVLARALGANQIQDWVDQGVHLQ